MEGKKESHRRITSLLEETELSEKVIFMLFQRWVEACQVKKEKEF